MREGREGEGREGEGREASSVFVVHLLNASLISDFTVQLAVCTSITVCTSVSTGCMYLTLYVPAVCTSGSTGCMYLWFNWPLVQVRLPTKSDKPATRDNEGPVVKKSVSVIVFSFKGTIQRAPRMRILPFKRP